MVLAVATALLPAGAEARESGPRRIDIEAGTLRSAIEELSSEQHISIGTSGRLPDLKTTAVRGTMRIEEALRRLLGNSGYQARRVGERAWRITRRRERVRRPSTRPPSQADRAVSLGEAEAIPIVVTASKREVELARLPLAVSIVRFSEDDPDAVSSGTRDVAARSEGLSLSGLGPGRNRIFLRGTADSAFNGESQSTVAVVLDQSRVTYSAPDPDLRLVDMKRVELIKGPQGSLYGTGALGGIYRLVTNKPVLGSTSLAIAASGHGIADGGIGQSLSGVANLPLIDEDAALRMVGYWGRDAGWIDTGSRKNSNSTYVLGGRASLRALLGEDWQAELGGAIQLLDSRDSQYVYSAHARLRPAQLGEPHDNDFRHLAFRLSGYLGGIRLRANSGFTLHEIRNTLDATIGADGFGLPDAQLFLDQRSYRVWDNELRLSGQLGSGNWLVGLAHIEARQKLNIRLTDSAANALVIDDDRRTSIDSAIFADLSLPLTSALNLDVGGRLFRSVTRETRNSTIGLVSDEVSKSGLTPMVSLSWTPRDGRIVFLRYGSAFRQGGADISRAGKIEPLKSDELATIEIGWRETFASGAKMSLGAYVSIWENIQSDLLLPNGLIESANIGDGRIIGFEASATIPLSPDLSLDLGANLANAVRENSVPRIGDADARLPVVPKYVARARLSHDFSIGALPAHLAAGLRYVGPSDLSFDPLVNQPMGEVLESNLQFRIGWEKFLIALTADNLFNSGGTLFAFGNPLRFASVRQFTPQAPLTIRLSARRAF